MRDITSQKARRVSGSERRKEKMATAVKVDPTEYRVPRSFKLLAELESSEKGAYTDTDKYTEDCVWITLGLDGADSTFTHWNATIIPEQGGYIGERMYSIKLNAGPGYPDDPPVVSFVNKVAMPCVDASGVVDLSKMYVSGFRWNRERSLFDVLLALRKEMTPKEVAQACARIAADATYS